MKSDHLDQIIKDALENFDAGSAQNSWGALNQKLNAWDTNDLPFDETIKNKLENIEEKYEPATWTNLAAALDFIPEIDHINADIILDEKAQNLSKLEDAYDANTWEVLEQKIILDDDLSSIEVPEEVDLAAYDKLSNFNVPFNENHWNTFQPELDKEFVLPYRLLFKYKLVEASFILLLLLGIYQHAPFNFDQKSTEPIADLVDNDLVNKSNVSEINLNDLDENSLAESTVKTNTQIKQSANGDLINNEVNIVSNTEVQNSAAVKAQIAISSIKQNPQVVNPSKYRASVELFNVPNKVQNELQKIGLQNLQSIAEKSEIISNTIKINEAIKQSPSLKVALLSFLKFNEKQPVPNCLVCENPVSLFKWRLSAQVNTDYNYIMTPYDKVLSVKSYAHAALGYGAGLAASVGIGDWEVELGSNYVARSYTPKPSSERVGSLSDGYIRIELDKIELNLLNIPLNVRYYFSNDNKTKYFVSGGASLNVAMQANYFRTAEFASREKTFDLKSADELLDNTLTNSRKIYSLGWVDGGSFIENRFFTADIGVGLERQISSRYSIFGQAKYQHYLDKGIGPNKDRFNTLQFAAGARAKFR